MAEHTMHRGLMEYDRKTIAQFATEIGVSHQAIHKILKNRCKSVYNNLC